MAAVLSTIDENSALQLPTSSVSFESQTEAPITGPVVKRRGGMSQLTQLSEEDEEEEEESEESEKKSSETFDDVLEEETSDSSVEDSSRELFTIISSIHTHHIVRLQFRSWRTRKTLPHDHGVLHPHALRHIACAFQHHVQISKPYCTRA